MHEIPHILTERVDDIPLWLEQRQRMGLPTLFDDHVPIHGNWQGLSVGWVSPLWLRAILSRGDHRLGPGEPWVAKRLGTRGATTGPAVTRVDCPDARLESVLRRLRDDTRWAACASARNPHTVRGSALSPARVQVESPRARAYATGTEGGLFPCGHRKEDRPDLPPVTVMQAVLDPCGRPVATDGVSGARADAPLSGPCMARVQARVGRRGRWSGGDGKMAARETRAFLAAPGDLSVGPLPHVQRAAGELAAAREAVWRGARTRIPVCRERPDGTSAWSAEGSEYPVPLSQEVGGEGQRWTERRWVVRSGRQAHAAEAALRARVAKAMAQSEALKHRGRGKKRLAEVRVFRQAVGAIMQRERVAECLGRRVPPHAPPRPVRAYRGRPARLEEERHATVEVCVEAGAVAAAVRQWGWRVDGTKQPRESVSLEPSVLASRSAYLVERRGGRLTGRPLSLTPRSVPREDHATGLRRWVSSALRVLTLVACVGRRQLAAEGTALAGLSAGNPRRDTSRPTAARRLEAFRDITLTMIAGPQQTDRHLTALSPLQQRSLEIVGFSSALYTRLCTVSAKPP